MTAQRVRVRRRRVCGVMRAFVPRGAIYVAGAGFGLPSSGWEPPYWTGATSAERIAARAESVEQFRLIIAGDADFRTRIQTHLRDRDLACYCAATDPCHGDVLLRVAAGGDP